MDQLEIQETEEEAVLKNACQRSYHALAFSTSSHPGLTMFSNFTVTIETLLREVLVSDCGSAEWDNVAESIVGSADYTCKSDRIAF